MEDAARPVLHHRTAEFRALFGRVRAALAEVAEVPGEDVLLLSGSGTSAFEATLLASVPAGGRVVALTGGRLGDESVARFEDPDGAGPQVDVVGGGQPRYLLLLGAE